MLIAVAIGGATGALLRFSAGLLWPTADGSFPATTLGVNVVGCLAIGALMAVLAERAGHRLLRPFLGTGVLGGFTTFSTYCLDIANLTRAGRPVVALSYLAATAVGAVAATAIALLATRRVRAPTADHSPAAGSADTGSTQKRRRSR